MTNKRRTGLFLVTLAAILGLMLAMAGAAYAKDAVNYQEASWNGTNKQVVYTSKSISSYTPVISDMDVSWGSGWYVVNSDVTIEDRIVLSGTVNLILCDECTLTAKKGISVVQDNALKIYSQSAGTGELVAYNEDYSSAGIGNSLDGNSGEVTIHGGVVTATGDSGAGIGGGNWNSAGPIKIYGGTVTATSNSGAGIGGGSKGGSGDITIYGGTVTATGSSGAGIGGGYSGDGITITIHGGNVMASSRLGAGIGGGQWKNGGTITINGGTVTASGYSSAGIGGGYEGSGETITINGGLVVAWTYEGRAIGGGYEGGDGKLTVANGLKVYGGDDEYPRTPIAKDGDNYPRFRYMTVDCGHEFYYRYYSSENGSSLLAECSKDICSLPDKMTELTIVAPERTVYGDTEKSAEATLNGLRVFRSATGVNVGDIMYSGRKNTTYDSSDPPENAGDYTAKATITIDAGWSYTLSVDYTITLPDLVPPASWTGSGTEKGPFVISDAEGWNKFAELVKEGYTMEGLFFRLGNNIEVTDMVGTYERPFSGSFDGDGHTLTFNADDAPEICAPFVYAKDASFKNLHIAGTIKTSKQFAAGLIGHFDGMVNVTNCCCSITIDSSVNGDGTHGGFIAAGEANGAAFFEGCTFDGKLLGPKTTKCGGFLGWANPTDKTYTVKNCLFAPRELTLRPVESFNFIRNAPGTTDIQNSYYTKNISDNSQGKVPGKSARTVTADEGITLSSGTAKYDVSGITAHETGLVYEASSNERVYYAGKDDKISVTIQSVCDEITANAGTLVRDGTAFTLTMPDENVTLTLSKGANHQWETEYTVDKEATCTEEGSESIHCSVCKEIKKDTVRTIKKTAHNYGEWTVTKDATCTEDGSKEKVCSACGDKLTEVITAQGHQWKDATCTEPKTCEVCQTTEGKALGHAWGAWAPLDENQHQRVCANDSTHTDVEKRAWDEGIVIREATTEEAGEKLFTCGVCEATRTESIPVLDLDPITPSDVTADTAPVDPGIPVIDVDRITTAGNFARKEMKIIFPADVAVTNYRIQYRKAGETDWQASWSAGTDTYIIHDLAKASLCEFQIAGYVKLEDGSWVRGEWSDVAYRYMKSVKLKSAKASKTRIALKWAKDKKGSGYQIKYFTDKNIHMADADTITIKGKKKTKYTIKQLQKGQTYYVRIRPIKIRNGIEYIGILKNTKKVKVK